MRAAACLVVLLTLAGCATAPGPERETEFQRLARECREQGGILMPLPGRSTGYPAADNGCHMHGGGERVRR